MVPIYIILFIIIFMIIIFQTILIVIFIIINIICWILGLTEFDSFMNKSRRRDGVDLIKK